MMLAAITMYETDPNLLTAVLTTVLGVLFVALCLIIGMYALRFIAQKNKMSIDEYRFEKREEAFPVKEKKPRHSKKRSSKQEDREE